MDAAEPVKTATPFADAIRILEAGYYEPHELATWLTLPHPQLGDRTPIQALFDEDGAQEVLSVVRRLDDAVYL